MRRTGWLQETRTMRFQEAFCGWTEKRLIHEEAARRLGVWERTFRRDIDRYEDETDRANPRERSSAGAEGV